MRARWLIPLSLLVLFGRVALPWDTYVGGKAGSNDWHAIYGQIPVVRNGQVELHGNEHAEISATALQAIGAGQLLDLDSLPLVVDINASYFRRTLLYGKAPYQPSDAPRDGLERRILPQPSQFSGIPDFSYSLYDWINKNQLCPLPRNAPKREQCHDYSAWLGAALNGSHFGTQAALNFKRLHGLALFLAERARTLRQRLEKTPGAVEAYRDHLREAEWMALAYEGVAQHFLADRWSTGHMWERWNAGDYDHLASRDLEVDFLAGIISGMIHGMQSVLHAQWDIPLLGKRGVRHLYWPDPLSSPSLTIETEKLGKIRQLWKYYWKGESAKVWLRDLDPPVYRHRTERGGAQGIGDYGFRDLLDGDFGGAEYGFENELPLPLPVQRQEMMSCVEAAWADVIRALGRWQGGYGVQKIPLKEAVPTMASLGERCFDPYVTNRSIMLAWPFSRPTAWSQLGRAVLTVFSNKAAQQLSVLAVGVGNPVVGGALAGLKKALARQVEKGRLAARNMVRISYYAWRYGREKPGGIELATGAWGPLDFTADAVSRSPGMGEVKRKGVILTGDHYGAADYFPPEKLDGLPRKEAHTGRDLSSLSGFFSRAMADYWAPWLPQILPALRGAREPWKESLCEYLVDQLYDGTLRDYQGVMKESRMRDGRPFPSYLTAIGKSPVGLRSVPVRLPPGYVSLPGERTPDGSRYQSIRHWCEAVPILRLSKDPDLRDQDVVARVDQPGVVRLQGENLGEAQGAVLLDCGEKEVTLPIQSWSRDEIQVIVDGRLPEGRHRLCVQRRDGKRSVGHFFLEYQPAPPRVRMVRIDRDGKVLVRSPGDEDRALMPGTHLVSIFYDHKMDTAVLPPVRIDGPSALKLKKLRWLGDDTLWAELEIPKNVAPGNYRFVIGGLGLTGLALDADPATEGAQPDAQHGFRVTTRENLLSTKLVGCWRWRQGVAVEILKDGRVRLIRNGKKVFDFQVLESGDDRVTVGFTDPRKPSGWYGFMVPYRLPHRNEDGVVECKGIDWSAGMLRCTAYDWGGRESPMDQKVTQVSSARYRWTWRVQGNYLNRDGEAQTEAARYRVDGMGVVTLDEFPTPEGVLVTPQASPATAGTEDEGMPAPVVPLPTLPDDPLDLAVLIKEVPLDLRSPTPRGLLVVDAAGQRLARLEDGQRVWLQATAEPGCPGLAEQLEARVGFPGNPARQKVMLTETGPATDLYRGPKEGLRVNLRPGMQEGTFTAVLPGMYGVFGPFAVPPWGMNPAMEKKRAAVDRQGNLRLKVVPRGAVAKPAPTKPSRTRTAWRLETVERGGGRLPDLYLHELRLVEDDRQARLQERRYWINTARGDDGVTIWSIAWGKPETVREKAVPLGQASRLRDQLRRGFELAELPDRLRKATGGEARPRTRNWMPPRQPAKSSRTAHGSGKRHGGPYRYHGPAYRAEGTRTLMMSGAQGGGFSMPVVVYQVPGKRRIETVLSPAMGVSRAITIEREDLGVIWELQPQLLSYAEKPLSTAGGSEEYEGEEIVDGRRLQRYRWRPANSREPLVVTLWRDERGIPVRTVMELPGQPRMETRFDKIEVGPVDPKLFELPPNYRRR